MFCLLAIIGIIGEHSVVFFLISIWLFLIGIILSLKRHHLLKFLLADAFIKNYTNATKKTFLSALFVFILGVLNLIFFGRF